MKENDQIIAIAECCGWVWYRIPHHRNDERRYRSLFLPQLLEYEGQSDIWKVRADGTESVSTIEYMHRDGYVPKYTTDLNAMRDAWETLPWDERWQFEKYLDEIVRRENPASDCSQLHMLKVNATAAQRSEAFLRTKGKWTQ